MGNEEWSEEKETRFQKELEVFKFNSGRIPSLEEEMRIWHFVNESTEEKDENDASTTESQARDPGEVSHG